METVDKNQTIDETKRKLQASREELEGELEYQLQDIKKDAADIGKQVLIAGGGLYVSYKLIKHFAKDKKKKAKKNRRKAVKKTGFGDMLMHQLITLAAVAVSDQVKKAFKQNKAVDDHQKDS